MLGDLGSSASAHGPSSSTAYEMLIEWATWGDLTSIRRAVKTQAITCSSLTAGTVSKLVTWITHFTSTTTKTKTHISCRLGTTPFLLLILYFTVKIASELVSLSPVFCYLIFSKSAFYIISDKNNTKTLCYSFVLNLLWLPIACKMKARILWMALRGLHSLVPASFTLKNSNKLPVVLSCRQWRTL